MDGLSQFLIIIQRVFKKKKTSVWELFSLEFLLTSNTAVSLCLCCPGSHLRLRDITKRKSFFFLMLMSLRFTLTISYAYVTSVNQPLLIVLPKKTTKI